MPLTLVAGIRKMTFAPPSKNIRSKRPSTASTVNTATTSAIRKPLPIKEKNVISRPKINKNATVIGDADITMCKVENFMPDFDAEYRQIAYGKFLRAMLEDCLVEEKIEREETQMDIQMAQLADRFQKTMDQLDKTNRRLKDINFVVEQKRLLDLKNKDCSTFYNMTENSNIESILNDLSVTEEIALDKLETKNVDFGYNDESGHKQLLDAVNDAIEGLNQIKNHSNLDINKFKEYEKSQMTLEELERDRFDLDSLKAEFETKFPKFSERLLKDVSEKIATIMDNDD
ncbi:uncharacterized protein LOC126780076 isoform X2 [Nymphalis io]|uniref:uncharacterized protein LOC126780076 isoform X2 n=1 Tax=Inachis io TaxID=171585 RepID=UPI002168B93A|nr:uncharacterized protein LOC126780076 isoform X2 [Nymphalis io]